MLTRSRRRPQRIEVIADDEEEIAEAVLRMHKNYDLVITSGGIGPTHDDITCTSLMFSRGGSSRLTPTPPALPDSSIAKAFGDVGLEYHEETKHRMHEMGKHRYNMDEQTEEQKTARLRMALFPKGAEVLFVQEDLCVPFFVVLAQLSTGPCT